MVKKSLLDNKYRFPSIVTKEDYVLWLELSKKDVKFYGINRSLTQWKKLNNSLSSNFFQKVKDGFVVYNKYMKYDIFTSTYYLLRLSLNFLLKM
jgi:teichuronic acid biosynthesis glycosyltransferase TuaG